MTSEGRGSRVEGRGYQQLLAWKKAHSVAVASFHLSERLRTKHRWLADQLVRSAVSIPANIAEGYNRGSLREYIYHLNISRGSAAEVEYYLRFAQDANLLTPRDSRQISSDLDEASRLLLSLLRSLQAKDTKRTRMIRDEEPAYEVPETDDFDSTLDPRPSTLKTGSATREMAQP